MGKTELKLEIDPLLLEQAKAAGLPVNAIFERAVRAALGERAAEERARRWAEENAEAIRDHKERIAKYGVFGEDLRTW